VTLPATPLPRPTRDPELQDLFDALVQARSEHRHELAVRDPTHRSQVARDDLEPEHQHREEAFPVDNA